MIRNYLKVAWRNIARNKVYSAINILGLAAGMAVALLIGLWAYNEYSYDRFLPENQNLYQVRRNFNSNGDTLNFPTVSLKLGEQLRRDIPEIEYLAESDWMGSHGLVAGDKRLYLNGGLVGDQFLNIFQFPLRQGQLNNVFRDPNSIVLTVSTAASLFGKEDPMNKLVRLDNSHELRVTGILEDLPVNSTLQFKFLVPFSFADLKFPYIREQRVGSFGENSYQLFVKLKDGVNKEAVAAKIRNIEHTETGNLNAMSSYVVLQPVTNWHLYGNYQNGKETGGFLEYVKMFTLIGLLVLLIACINFVNLTTARSEKRAKEVGIRKAIGSLRKNLIAQFLLESLLLSSIAFVVSVVLVQLALPAFNALTGKQLRIPFTNPTFWLLLIAAVLITALLAGSRPAFYLSSFQPVKVLKGMLRTGSTSWSRKVLVVVQFSCSIALIISTFVVYRQIQHAKSRPIGMDLNRLMITEMNDDLGRNFTALKQDMIQSGLAEAVTMASSPAADIYWHTDVEQWPGKRDGETIEMGTIIVGEDYFQTMGMKLKQGRNFSSINDTLSVIFNEAAIERMRIKEPLGQRIQFNGMSFSIAGVAANSTATAPFAQAEPTMYFINKGNHGLLLYRIASSVGAQQAINKMTALFGKYSPAFPYTYQFADQAYAGKFSMELLIGKLAAIFSALAIFISCLGLFGLAAYIAEKRTKEIGIRKVLGASVSQVWAMLSKDFVLLVLISVVIASPVALYFLQGWLEKYPYRISIGYGVFLGAGAIALLLTLVTVSFQAISAALANPVKSLRSE